MAPGGNELKKMTIKTLNYLITLYYQLETTRLEEIVGINFSCILVIINLGL